MGLFSKKAKYEFHVALAQANATKETDYNTGESHGLMVILNQEINSEYEPEKISLLLNKLGWVDVNIEKIGRKPNNSKTIEENPSWTEYFKTANSEGYCIIVYHNN